MDASICSNDEQIECSIFKGKPIFYTNGHEANLFGLEPNYGCCTADFSQAWPKFALSTFASNNKGVYASSIAPAILKTNIEGVNVCIECITYYPFNNKVTYRVKAENPYSFTFGIRIPMCCEKAVVNGVIAEKGTMYEINKVWNNDEVNISFEFVPKFVQRPNNMVCLWYGPLLFVLPIEEQWVMHEYERNGVIRKFPYCDYEVFPKSKWNYAFASNSFNISFNGIQGSPFSRSKPPVTITTDMYEIAWGYERDMIMFAEKLHYPGFHLVIKRRLL